MDAKTLVQALFEKDVLVTAEQAALLDDNAIRALRALLNTPAQAEAYLATLKSKAKPAAPPPPATTPPPPAPAPRVRQGVTVLRNYAKKPKKRSYEDFVRHYTVRLTSMERFLRSRADLASLTSVERARQHGKAAAAGNEKVSLIGLVMDKRETKNEHIILELEDRSGMINVLVSKNKPQQHAIAQDICPDEIIGITGTVRDDIIFCDELYTPAIPAHNELKRSPDEAYAVCVSDIHFGNKNFFADEFSLFLKWLAGEHGNEQWRAMSKKTQYVFIPGDLVEGVGVYPSQEGDLSIKDIFEQYKLADEWLCRIPESKDVFVIPGNHDIGRLSEPQPPIGPELLPRFAARERVHLLSNPSLVRFHESATFPGFTTLLYHGGSFFYYGNNVMRLFREGGMSNPCAIMQHLLQRRHLAPAHTSTLYVPDPDEDPLIIEEVPDFLMTGHLHTTQTKTVSGVTLISASCWVPLTEYQIKAGLLIDPGKFLLINLKTREVLVLRPQDIPT